MYKKSIHPFWNLDLNMFQQSKCYVTFYIDDFKEYDENKTNTNPLKRKKPGAQGWASIGIHFVNN